MPPTPPKDLEEIGLDVSRTKRIFGTADVAEALGITPEGVRSAVRHRETEDRPKWLEDPMPEKVNGGHVWDRQSVERMVAKAPTPRVRRKKAPAAGDSLPSRG